MVLLLLALLALLLPHAPASAQPVPGNPTGSRHLHIDLVPESTSVAPGSSVTLALATRPDAGWHGYWSNPGDAGFPPDLKWTLPPGATVSAPAYPVPSTLLISGLMNYVFERHYAPLVELRVPADAVRGATLPLRVDLRYLVCTREICVPEFNTLTLDLTVGDASPRDPRFDGWRRAIPKPIGTAAQWRNAAGRVSVSIPYPADAPLTQAYLFALTQGAIDYAAPQQVSRDGDRVVIETAGGHGPRGVLDGVLRIGPDRGVIVRATYGEVPAATRSAIGWTAALLALAGAVLGGLILNVMPCVFPILSLKAISLARSGAGEREARIEALAYTAGVIGVCIGLGALILALRAGGAQVGWAFQLQNPAMLMLLGLLSAAIAFNLAGLFELPTPPLGRWEGAGGAFATGALAALVATPCTGPFMGAALGAALVLPWPVALAIFAGLGVGLALPFLLIGFVPALRRRLPKPGEWMATARRILSVPMFLTAVALAWVFGRRAGVDALSLALLAVLGLGLVLWAGGRRQSAGLGFGRGWAAAALLIATAAAIAATHAPKPAAGRATASGDQPFSEQRLAALRAQGRPVFVYFTADWCLTCKVNERVAIDTTTVRDAFRRGRIAVLKGDWTDGDPALGRVIEAHQRAGIPLYLFYPAGADTATVLPQVLTPGVLTARAR